MVSFAARPRRRSRWSAQAGVHKLEAILLEAVALLLPAAADNGALPDDGALPNDAGALPDDGALRRRKAWQQKA